MREIFTTNTVRFKIYTVDWEGDMDWFIDMFYYVDFEQLCENPIEMISCHLDEMEKRIRKYTCCKTYLKINRVE